MTHSVFEIRITFLCPALTFLPSGMCCLFACFFFFLMICCLTIGVASIMTLSSCFILSEPKWFCYNVACFPMLYFQFILGDVVREMDGCDIFPLSTWIVWAMCVFVCLFFSVMSRVRQKVSDNISPSFLSESMLPFSCKTAGVFVFWGDGVCVIWAVRAPFLCPVRMVCAWV